MISGSAELAEAQQSASASREQAAAAAERYRAQAEDWAHARQQLQTANEEVRWLAAHSLLSTMQARQFVFGVPHSNTLEKRVGIATARQAPVIRASSL